MKIQDLFFIAILVVLLITRRPKWLVMTGLVCLILAIPLFGAWVFFTAQRLTYYAAGFFLAAAIMLLLKSFKE